MRLPVEPWETQRIRWPVSGRHVLAQFDAATIVVYQAYRQEIGRFAVEHQRFGGAFSYGRMSWIKPNFLWMMYRSEWGTAEGQEVVLAVTLRREAFDGMLAAAVPSSFVPERDADPAAWQERVRTSEVRVQWDPDHGPSGERQERRALQLGLRGETLRRYGQEWIVRIDDVSDFVAEQRPNRVSGRRHGLLTPREEVYPAAAGV